MRRSTIALASAALVLLAGCRQIESQHRDGPPASYFDNSGHSDAWTGGARKINISTPKGPHQVWIKRVGNNPKLKLLLLIGGPGFSHAYLEVMDSYLPAEGVEYYYYDQLETGESDKPDDPDLWTLPRYVDEVDQVRRAIGGDRSNFCLLGHSWGGMLAMEYAGSPGPDEVPGDFEHDGLDPRLQRLCEEGARAADEPGGTEADPRHGGVRQDRGAGMHAAADAQLV
jgi:hypothetical protein